jgi:hypothetical protein
VTSDMVVAGPLWTEISSRCILLVDVILLVVLCLLHILAIQSSVPAANDKAQLAESVRSGATGGLTIVGILIPLSVLAIQLRTGTSSDGTGLPNSVLIDFFVAAVWLIVSLAAGLYVLFVAAIRGTYEDIGQRKDVVILFGYQLIFLFVGVCRMIWGMSGLVGSLLSAS